ncbi:MAG: S-methyl-5-thioribose-1-phosphate isomerase, partial [Candidatus Kapabacteria bacterium]|nr:S-methyl-5-thioribose-1-phosphate isomerase [Candidatus Kapabacteria bacterium]
MLVNGVPYRTIWRRHEGAIAFIDQNLLPHRFAIKEATSVEEMAEAIRHMSIRGAIALGAAAAYGLELAAHRAPDTELPAALHHAATLLKQTRPTAVNIAWATDSVLEATAEATTPQELRHLLRTAVDKLVNAEIERCRRIGEHGMHIIKSLAEKKEGAPVNILTHCNAGWLGCVDYGTALAPIYVAANNGIQLHVWVSETRPRNQGSAL